MGTTERNCGLVADPTLVIGTTMLCSAFEFNYRPLSILVLFLGDWCGPQRGTGGAHVRCWALLQTLAIEYEVNPINPTVTLQSKIEDDPR